MRNYLVYVPCAQGRIAAALWDNHRLFDVALNDYTGAQAPNWGEYGFKTKGHKWPAIVSLGLPFFARYKAVCFLDDDIEIDATRLNQLFAIGNLLNLDLWQASLTEDSQISWPHLVQMKNSYVRGARTVEIMMPIFSRSGLAACWPSFAESQSGWGLDDLWPKLLNGKGLAVVDAVAARHARKVQSGTWVMPNGKKPQQERNEIEKKYELKKWQRENGYEPWEHE